MHWTQKKKHIKQLNALIEKNRITKEDQKYIRLLHGEVLHTTPKHTSCGSCIKGWIKNIIFTLQS